MKIMLNMFLSLFLFALSFAVTFDVTIVGMTFEPSSLAIPAGSVVRWTNNSTISHTATSTDAPAAWQDANISPSATFEITFNNVGNFPYDCAYHPQMTGTIIVDPEELGIENSALLIETFQLNSNYPNPFNPTTTIEYSLLENSFVELIIYNTQGRQIYTLIDDFITAGHFSIKWDASSYPSGIYIAKMTSGEYVSTKKLMLIK